MSRIDIEPNVFQMVKELEDNAKELKEAQRVGSDAVKTFCIQTADAWDYSAVISYPTIIEKTLTFIPADTTGDKPTSAAFKVLVKYENGQVDVRKLRITDFKQQKWRITIDGYGGSPTTAKFYVFTTGEGSITIT